MDDSDFFCNDYDWELFFRISTKMMPEILRDAYSRGMRFCVIGGKAVDAHTAQPAYSANYVGSPDWDIDTSNKDVLVKFIMDSIIEEIPTIRLFTAETVKEIGTETYHGTQIGIYPPSNDLHLPDVLEGRQDCTLPFFADIFNVGGFVVQLVEGIPYKPSKKLLVELIRIVNDRQELVRGGYAMLPSLEITNRRIESNNEEIGKLKRKIGKKCKDEKLEELINDIIMHATENGRLGTTAKNMDFSKHHKKFFNSIEKLQRTQRRLQEMIRINPGHMREEICKTCTKDISSVIDGVSCKLIQQYCRQ